MQCLSCPAGASCIDPTLPPVLCSLGQYSPEVSKSRDYHMTILQVVCLHRVSLTVVSVLLVTIALRASVYAPRAITLHWGYSTVSHAQWDMLVLSLFSHPYPVKEVSTLRALLGLWSALTVRLATIALVSGAYPQ